MKKMILTGTLVLVLAGASLQSARAGDREWATVGKVLTGVAVAGLIVAAAGDHAQANVTYTYGAPAYCPPPVVIAPAPVVVYRAPVVVYPAHYRWNNGYSYRHEHW